MKFKSAFFAVGVVFSTTTAFADTVGLTNGFVASGQSEVVIGGPTGANSAFPNQFGTTSVSDSFYDGGLGTATFTGRTSPSAFSTLTMQAGINDGHVGGSADGVVSYYFEVFSPQARNVTLGVTAAGGITASGTLNDIDDTATALLLISAGLNPVASGSTLQLGLNQEVEGGSGIASLTSAPGQRRIKHFKFQPIKYTL